VWFINAKISKEVKVIVVHSVAGKPGEPSHKTAFSRNALNVTRFFIHGKRGL